MAIKKDTQIPWNKGIPMSEETKQKISAVNKDKHFSPQSEFKPGYEGAFAGKEHSKESKTKMSESHMGIISPNKGKKMSEEQKEKLSKANLKRFEQFAEENAKIGEQVRAEKEEGKTRKQLSVKYKLSVSTIQKILSGKIYLPMSSNKEEN